MFTSSAMENNPGNPADPSNPGSDTLKVLHILHQSLPDHQSGYDIRSHAILTAQRALGIDARALTGPYCRSGSPQILDGVPYYRTPGVLKNVILGVSNRSFIGKEFKRSFFARTFTLALRHVVNDFRPDVIHAHTPWFTALPSMTFAKRHGIPFVYEARGLWEESELTEGIITRDSDTYQSYRKNDETLVAGAEAVVTISEALRGEFAQRVVGSAGKIRVVTNGVDTRTFAPRQRDESLVRNLGLEGKVVLGCVSSLRKLEGIDYLLDAMPLVVPDASLIVVGDGPELPHLRTKAGELGIEARVRFAGRVPHADVPRYYSIIDVFVVPRIAARVCQLVTPIKPLEAMAMAKCVLASNVGGMRELVVDGITGVLFEPQNVEDLAHKVDRLTMSRDERQRYGRQALDVVTKERSWEILGQRYVDMYNSIGQNVVRG